MIGLWASGLLWLLFHYLLRKQGAFGSEPHPLEPLWLKVHGAFAFAGLFMFGLIWGAHVVNGWSTGRRRWSGGAVIGLVLVLTLTGYLLYYAGDDGIRGAVSLTHWLVGLGGLAVFLLHRFARDGESRRQSSGRRRLAASKAR